MFFPPTGDSSLGMNFTTFPMLPTCIGSADVEWADLIGVSGCSSEVLELSAGRVLARSSAVEISVISSCLRLSSERDSIPSVGT